MESVEVQIARLTALVESGQHMAQERHVESISRLVRIEGLQRETNGRVTTLEAWRAAVKYEDDKQEGEPLTLGTLTKWVVFAVVCVTSTYAVLLLIGFHK